MNIAYFSNQFAAASGHGIAHYTHRLYEMLADLPDIEILPVATYSNRSIHQQQTLSKETGLKLLPWGRKLTPIAWTFFNAPSIEHWIKDPIDIVHMLALGMPVPTKKKLVVTIHDIGPLTHPQYFISQKIWLVKRSFEHTIRHADAIICVSQTTADEVCEWAGKTISDRLHVVHEGVDSDFFSQPSLDPYKELKALPPRQVPFIMAAGAISPRKNIRRILEAFSKVQNSIPHHLVLVGGKGWDSDEIFKVLKSSTLSKKVHYLGYVSDEQMQALYKHADFYVHPSLFEGFGLTVLEAMAAGCPVITSNISSLLEISGKAALLVNPESVEEISDAIASLALNASLKSQLILKGLSHVQAFKWQSTAQGVANVYREVIN
jgi:glycosyltransferase involved in cell wall biosynthesis